MDPVVIGTGELHSQSIERYTDRYGAVHLNDPVGKTLTIDTSLVGTRGRLVAVFQSRRPSVYSGDLGAEYGLNREIARGTEIELGSGTLFVEPSRFGDTEVGVKPDDGRTENWLDRGALLNCRGQVVRLELHPETAPADDATAPGHVA